jgi:hypothetical protein
MSSLWLPPKVDADLAARTRAADVAKLEMFELRGPVQSEWNRELQQIDARFVIGKAHEDAEAPGVVPGFWHLLLDGPPLSVLPIHGPDGSFVEPSFALLERVRSWDLQNPRAVKDRHDQVRRMEASKEREAQRDEEDRREEIKDRVRAAWGVSVSMNRDAPWTQTAAARKDKK